MELLVAACWAALAAVHALPAAALIAPGQLKRLYGVEPHGPAGLLLTHRGALFLALVVLCLFAMADAAVRPAASVAVGLSVLSYLALYVRAGRPAGPLRMVAWADVAALAPLLVVTVAAFG